jgi:hypothetical protein
MFSGLGCDYGVGFFDVEILVIVGHEIPDSGLLVFPGAV